MPPLWACRTSWSPTSARAVETGLKRAASSLRKRTVNSGSDERRAGKGPRALSKTSRGGVDNERGDSSASSWSGEVDGGLGVGPTDAQGDELDSVGDVDEAKPTPLYLHARAVQRLCVCVCVCVCVGHYQRDALLGFDLRQASQKPHVKDTQKPSTVNSTGTKSLHFTVANERTRGTTYTDAMPESR
jgi:hypothetical protein